MNVALLTMMTPALFIMARIGGLMTFAPFFSNDAVSLRVKGCLTILLTALIYPVYRLRIPVTASMQYPRILLGEAAVGLATGLIANFVFESARLAGQIAGFQLGHSMASLVDPMSGADTPVLSMMHDTIAMLLFLQLNVHHSLIRLLVHSLDWVPIGSSEITASAVSALFVLAGNVFGSALALAAPVLTATLLVDFALGFASKAAPQLPVMLVGVAIKTLVAYLALWVSLASWNSIFDHAFNSNIIASEKLLHLFR